MSKGGGTQANVSKDLSKFGRSAASDLGYLSKDASKRVTQFERTTGFSPDSAGRRFGLDPGALNLGVRTGVAPFSADQQQSFGLARDFSGPNFGAANADLNAINFGQIDRDTGALRNFKLDPSVGRNINFLENFTGSQAAKDALGELSGFEALRDSQFLPLLLETAQGQFVDPGNPFATNLVKTIEDDAGRNFRESILPSIGAQFAASGAFNNSLRAPVTNQAADDFQRAVADQTNAVRFNVFENERQRQQAAQLAGVDADLAADQLDLTALSNAAAGQVDLSGQTLSARQAALRGGIDASSIRQSALQAALQGSLGSGNLRLGRAQQRASQAQATSAAQLAKIDLLNRQGTQQQALTQALALAPQARQDARFSELERAAGINAAAGGGGGGGEPNALTSTVGGAATGAAFGSIIPGFGAPAGAIAGGLFGLGGSFL
jgi:hypothetical protein